MLKKKLLLLLTILCCLSCKEDEDETVDITVMPIETTVGAGTFGCLVDGWLYVGGRYSYAGEWIFGDDPIASIVFVYDITSQKMSASVKVKGDKYIKFTIASPQEGKVSYFKEVRFGEEKLKDGKVTITRFDEERNIVSGTFEGGRISKGRFDVHYKEVELPDYPDTEELK